MYVSPEIKARVVAKLEEGIGLIAAKYGIKMAMPKISYDIRGTVAGYAKYKEMALRFNPTLLNQNVEDFVANIVPHELCHLAVEQIYPEEHRRQFRGDKRSPHGERWREIMRVCKVEDVTRCHSYDTTTSRVIRSNSRTIEWKCSKCSQILALSPNKSAKLRSDPHALWHRRCKGYRLIEVDAAPVAHQPPPQPVYRPAASFVLVRAPMAMSAVVPPASGQSKLDMCKASYQAHPHFDRPSHIAAFIRLSCTEKGAATYYHTCKKLYS